MLEIEKLFTEALIKWDPLAIILKKEKYEIKGFM